MNVEYLVGSKKEFYEFVDLITSIDKVAIVTHTDLDGLASALFMEKILESENLSVEEIYFLGIKKDMISEVLLKLKEKEISKVFVCDLGVDSIDSEGFADLRRDIDTFLIDHHPISEKLLDKRNLIKTVSADCSAMCIFDLGEEKIETEAWKWLNCAAIFSEFSYKKDSTLEYMKSIYPEISIENISSSIPGINARKINSSLVYYEHDKKHVYNLVKERKIEELTEIYHLIEDEINSFVENFSDKAEHYPEKNLHFYEIDSKFNLTSSVSTLVSKMKPEDKFVFIQRKGDAIKISARNQSGDFDMGALMKRCTEGLEGALGGGHRAAAGGEIRPEDLEEFCKRLLE